MPTFFTFQAGNEAAPRAFAEDNSPLLLGRFRAVPGPPTRPQNRRRLSQLGLLSHSPSDSPQQSHGLGGTHGAGGSGGGKGVGNIRPHAGRSYGSMFGDWFDGSSSDGEDGGTGTVRRRWGYGYMSGDDDGDSWGDRGAWLGPKLNKLGRRLWMWTLDVWVDPTQSAVRKVVGVWYSRWGVLVVLPASLAIAWCSIPIPHDPLPLDDDDHTIPNPSTPSPAPLGFTMSAKVPGHGVTRSTLSFPVFLLTYYALYNLTALVWITKVFNLYSLNWWPSPLGFPVTISLLAILSLSVPVPFYLVEPGRWVLKHNTAWVTWTFIIMAMPVGIAAVKLVRQERYVRITRGWTGTAATQRFFTRNWFTGGTGAGGGYRDNYGYGSGGQQPGHPNLSVETDPLLFTAPSDALAGIGMADPNTPRFQRRGRSRYPLLSSISATDGWTLPASFVRFIWFCLALFVGLMVYVMGEAYAEMYLRTLPHNNLETIVYVYSWVATVHLLDAITGWILGGNEGERVGSYPLGWVFKLYFMLTYQTYVRALYARLRSPSQFVILQLMSSTLLITATPVLMSRPFHRVLHFLGFNNQPYPAYQKMQARNVFIRGIAENASMLAFVGSVVVLHFGSNKDLYPYFAFDRIEDNNNDGLIGKDDQYDFNLTFYAANVTWACELVAQLLVRGLLRLIYKVNVGKEGKLDLAAWPELLPTSVVVMLHVLQNMLFSIIRLHFR